MATHTPETRDSNNTKPVSYSEMQDWLADQKGDFTDKIAGLVNAKGKNEPINLDRSPKDPAERRKPGTELLARYLHHLHKQDQPNIFTEIYDEYFAKPVGKAEDSREEEPVAHNNYEIPSAEDIIADFNSCCSSPDIETIERLGSKLSQLQSACKAYGLDMPRILNELISTLHQLKQPLYSYEDVKKSTAQKSSEIEQKLASLGGSCRTAIELSVSVRGKKTSKKPGVQAESEMIANAKIKIDGLTKKLHELQKGLETDSSVRNLKSALSELRGINGVTLRQELQILVDSLTAKKDAKEQARKKATEKKAEETAREKESAEKQIPVPIDGASVVYLCIEYNHAKQGGSGDTLTLACAEDFAEFLVRSQSVDFHGLPPNAGKIKEILAIVTDPIRQTADDILSEFPFLNGLKISADFHEIEEYMSTMPAVSTEDMVKLVGYLKFLAISARDHGKWEGAGKQDLTLLENFVRNLEQIVIDRLTSALNQCPAGVEPYKWASTISNRQFFDHVDSTYHDPQQTKQNLKSLPERGHINKPSVIRTTIRNFIQDVYEAVGKPKEGDGQITKTFKDALRALAGKEDEQEPPSSPSAPPPPPPHEPEHPH